MGGGLIRLLEVPGREVWFVPASAPACFLLLDQRAGGILVNLPGFDADLAQAIGGVAAVRFIFFPSRFGAIDVAQWRSALKARTIASVEERAGIAGPIDEPLDGSTRIHGRLDFLPLPGRTSGTCALRAKAPPAIAFLGPALEHDPWPMLRAHGDDASYENRVIGALGLRTAEFEFAFCDNYSHGRSRFGPGANQAIAANLVEALESQSR